MWYEQKDKILRLSVLSGQQLKPRPCLCCMEVLPSQVAMKYCNCTNGLMESASSCKHRQLLDSNAIVLNLQIYTLMQQAMSIVKPFPYVVEKPVIFELLAAELNEPSAWQLMQPAGLDDLEHNARWQQVVNYLQTLTTELVDIHVPLAPSCRSPTGL